MRSNRMCILALLILWSGAVAAEEWPGVMLALSGPDRGATAIDALAVGFSLDRPHRGVTIEAGLSNNGGESASAGGMAWLMRGIGPVASPADVVARVDFELPGDFHDFWPLFEDLELEAGEYWLVFAAPPDVVSFASWTYADLTDVYFGSGVRFVGTCTTYGPAAHPEVVPYSLFGSVYSTYAYRLLVTGEAAADSQSTPFE